MVASIAASERPESVALPGQSGHAAQPRRLPYQLRLAADVASELDRYIPSLVAQLGRAFAKRRDELGGGQDELVIVLSDVSQVPHIGLVLLIRLLRQALGSGVTITLVGASPLIARPLTNFGLPEDVVVVDSRGRRWAG